MIAMPHAGILEMDMLSFLSLYNSIERIEAQDKNEAAWTAMIAAQGQHKNMDKHTKTWRKVVLPRKPDAGGEAKASMKSFQEKHGNGF